jgi:hypothetical protein
MTMQISGHSVPVPNLSRSVNTEFHAGISTTVALVTRDAKHLFVRVSVDDKKIKKKDFDKKAPLGPCDVPFDPP